MSAQLRLSLSNPWLALSVKTWASEAAAFPALAFRADQFTLEWPSARLVHPLLDAAEGMLDDLATPVEDFRPRPYER